MDAGTFPPSVRNQIVTVGGQSTAVLVNVTEHSVERNREALFASAQSALEGLNPEQHVASISIDIRGFTDINMMFGFENGDSLLNAVADRISRMLRPNDVLYRTGDDEFSILLNPMLHRDHALLAVHRVQRLFDQTFSIAGSVHTLDVDIGLALYPDTATDAAELIRQSVYALHRAKKGHGEYVIYDTDLESENRRQQQISQEIKEALHAGRIKLVYQPLVDPSVNKVSGVESLARWVRDGGNVVSPAEFIPVVEKTGLIGKFTQLVLNTALRECGEVLEWFITVNISAINLEQIDFPEIVKRALSTWKVEPSRLVLEVTETTIMRDLDSTRFVLRKLSEMGVLLAIDDFGSGYSSLKYIKELPVSYLKIDGGFVKNLKRGSGDIMIVDAVCKLGHSFGLNVIAEGIETEESLRIATELGCDLLQGYYLSRPVDSSQFRKILKQYP